MAFYSSFVPRVTKPSESYCVSEWEHFLSPGTVAHDVLFQLKQQRKKKTASMVISKILGLGVDILDAK